MTVEQCTKKGSNDACSTDPELQSFGHTIERTKSVINSLALAAEAGSLSLKSLNEVKGCLQEMNQKVIMVILECKTDICNNQRLSKLVDNYFDTSLLTLNFFTELEDWLNGACHGTKIIRNAIRQFEDEGIKGINYAKLLKNLQNFRSAGDSFTKTFSMIFEPVYKQQLAMLKELQAEMKKLKKKLRYTKTGMRVPTVILATTFVSALIFSAVALAGGMPLLVTHLAVNVTGVLAVLIGPVCKWCDSRWKNYYSALKRKKELISPMEAQTNKTIKEMDNIKDCVNELEVKIKSLMRDVNLACSEDGAVKILIGDIKKKLEILQKKFDELSQEVEGCRDEIRMARKELLGIAYG